MSDAAARIAELEAEVLRLRAQVEVLERVAVSRTRGSSSGAERTRRWREKKAAAAPSQPVTVTDVTSRDVTVTEAAGPMVPPDGGSSFPIPLSSPPYPPPSPNSISAAGAAAAPPAGEVSAPQRPALVLQPSPSPSRLVGRKLSDAEALAADLAFQRAGLFPGRPDMTHRAAWTNTKLGPLLAQHGRDVLIAAHKAFLADEWAHGLSPPCPLETFVARLPKYLPAPAGSPPRAAGRGRADLTQMRYDPPGDPDAIR